MKVRGTLAALVAITAALTLTHHDSPQVHAHAVDNSQAAVAGQSFQEDLGDLRDLRELHASRSRPVTTPSPLKLAPTKTTKTTKMPLAATRATTRSTSAPKPVQTENSRPSVSKVGWAHTREAYRVANCESGDRDASDVNTRYNGNPHLRDGKYHGKWQMDSDFWKSYGGLKYASDAADASEVEQDAVAYRGYQARGWQPWSCSRIMGVR